MFRIISLIVFAALTGCTTINPEVHPQKSATEIEWEQRLQAVRAMQAQPVSSPADTLAADRGITPAQREQQVAMAKDAAAWINSDPRTRVTTLGPRLSAYGEGYEAVARCKVDVARVAPQYDRKCYDLLPADKRELIYAADQKMPRRVADVRFIIIRN